MSLMHFKLNSRTLDDGQKIYIATFTSSFTASRFSDWISEHGYSVFEPNPLTVKDEYEVEFWK